ncbi:SDR family NAD(P)-dependent oxidoreductase [Kitasatospora sp. NPDC096147]|uniref:SDR family NAD(P)-dependent oxidoreductase n=1 Tax=Kitasatospora sp. NPDC096147 TaxID=3364093 RepID=UPI00382C86E0
MADAPHSAATPWPPVVLLTGASSGLGAATATRLAATGWRLLLSGRDRPRLRAVAAETGGLALPADLTAPGGPERLAASALAVDGRVDVLIADAGIGWRGPFAEMPLDTLASMVELNLTAPLRLSRLLLPGMLERGRGRIVLVGSIAGAVGVREEAVYAATKAALGLFAESLRYELRGSGVGVRVVVPGPVDTPFFARRGTPYQREHPRPSRPERVAETVHRAVTGSRDELVVPGWFRLPGRLHGAAPQLFQRLNARFG